MSNTPLGYQEHRLGADRTGWDTRSWLEVAVGRNPLIDPNHRQEAWTFLSTGVLIVVATVNSTVAAVRIWVDRRGHYLPTSQPAGQALTDASIAALTLWCTLTTLIAATTTATAWRRSLVRSRDKRLDAALTSLLTRTGRGGHRPSE